MNDIKHKVSKIASLKEEIEKLENELSEMSDGHTYILVIFCYGYDGNYTFQNEYLAQDVLDKYYGDNGFVKLYTTNEDFINKNSWHQGLNGHSPFLVTSQSQIDRIKKVLPY